MAETSLQFNSSRPSSLGVEVELQIVHNDSLDLIPIAPIVLHRLSRRCRTDRAKSEIFQSMIEIDTPICQDAKEAGAHLRRSVNLIRSVTDNMNSSLVMSGTHPFARYAQRLLTNDQRYNYLIDKHQWIARRLQIFGLHVHIGMPNGNTAIQVLNGLCHFLPLVLCFSASSPYWQGEDTGLASSRVTFFEALPTGGHPINVKSWTEFKSLIAKLQKSKSIKSLKDLWWDIRINPNFGTVEVRIADCPPTVAEVEAIVALLHCLTLMILEQHREHGGLDAPSDWILRENKWRATRSGVACDLIVSKSGETKPFGEVWSIIKDHMNPFIEMCGYQEQIDLLTTIQERGPSYARQRAVMINSDSLDAVVESLVMEGKADKPIYF